MEGSSGGGGGGGSRYALRSKKSPRRVSGGKDLESSSTPKRSEDMEAVSVKKTDYDSRSYGPDYNIMVDPKPFQKKMRRYVKKALECFNKSKKAKEIGEYELVEVKDVCPFFRPRKGLWYHANFIAKPKNAPDSESVVFFAELMYDNPAGRVKCLKCCILGPLDYGTKGCQACEAYFAGLRHPHDGFTIGYRQHLIPGKSTQKERCSS